MVTERILVRGVNWLGDAVMSTPALQRLREAEARAPIEACALDRARDYGVAAMAGAYASLYGRALSGSSSSR